MKITDYTNIREEQYPFIGGKAKGLHELSKYGYNVPPFFIIEDLTKEDYPLVLEYFKKSDLNNVSVRSSANNEDGKDYSFAGQYETVLNVQTEEEFIDALDKCLASLENIRSSLYSSTFAQNGKELKMTIVVQEMINADYAGVIFTKNPLNKEETLIEMVNGIGESLVSGTNNATQYFVTDKEIIKKGDPLVDFAFIRELKNIVDNMEKDFGYPLDIEFAIKDNDIYFLQARPSTINEEV